MAMEVTLKDSSSGTSAEVDTNGAVATTTPGYTAAGVSQYGGPEAGPAIFCENDPGTITGTRSVKSPEVDEDWRQRVVQDHLLDRETFNYSQQNTGKHTFTFTTLTSTVSVNGLLTNSGSGTAANTGCVFGTFAEFPVGHAASITYWETSMALNVNIASIPSNVQIDAGPHRRGASIPFTPLDGVYFRFSSAGISGVANNSGTEQTIVLSGVSGILANENHLYGISLTEKQADFWIDGVLYGSIVAPTSNAQLFRSATLPWSIRHANTGTVSSVVQALVTDYTVTYGGPQMNETFGTIGNRTLGSHQGLSGGTMGSLARYANNTTTAAGTGTNTAVITGHTAGLGGEYTMTAQVAAAVDNILCSYQVPAGTTAVQGRRLRVQGVKIAAANIGAAVATTATLISYNLAFGHTAISLANTESASFATATSKAARRVSLGMQSWAVGAGIGATAPDVYMPFATPIYVNPGEFIAIGAKFVVGTATPSQAIYFNVTFDYGWE